MKVMVTGGAGFIGSNLTKHLVAAGHEVCVLDDFTYGYLENLKGVKCGLVDIDISDAGKLKEAVSGHEPPDVIFHLAAIAPLSACQANPSRAYQVNVIATINVLEFARLHGCRVLFTSTSAVYESNTVMSFLTTDVVSPDLIYSMTKKHSEDVVESYRRNYGMNITNFRLFNVYGPAQDGNRKQPPIIPYLLNSMRDNKDITLYCDKTNILRDYIYIDDVVAAFDTWLNLKSLINGTYNICTGHGSSVQHIVEIARKVFPGYTGDVKYASPDGLWDKYPELFSGKNPLDKHRVLKEVYKSSIGDCAATVARLKGWRPQVSLQDGMAKMVV